MAIKANFEVVTDDADTEETEVDGRVSYTAILISQGKHRFYTLAMPSEMLAATCVVEPRNEDPEQGFQRALDEKRALEIAAYIDGGFGTIPSSIVLSAQHEANLQYKRSNRTLSFSKNPRAFLILDGQHRVYGFRKAKSNLRVPVVIYNNLTRAEECRLFIDINTKQRPVPNELLLDIKRLAATETNAEALSRDVFDAFDKEPTSPLQGLMTSIERRKGKISRVTFNNAMKTIADTFASASATQTYEILSAYLQACKAGLRAMSLEQNLTNPTLFRALMAVFPAVAERVSDRYANDFSVGHFEEVLQPLFNRVKRAEFERPGSSITGLSETFEKALKSGFTISTVG